MALLTNVWASLIAQLVKNLPEMEETPVQFLSWVDPLEKGKATHSSILAWRIPWTEEPIAYGVEIVRHDWASTHAVDYGLIKKEASSLDSGENVNWGMGFGAGIVRFIPLEDRWDPEGVINTDLSGLLHCLVDKENKQENLPVYSYG